MPTWQAVAVGVIPSIFVLLLFWFVIRAVIRADRNERRELARIEREDAERAANDAAPGSTSSSVDSPKEHPAQ